MSNFDFLKDFDDTLYKLGNRIEKEVNIAPSAVKADATPFLEYLVNKLLNRVGMKFNYRKDFYSQLDTVYRKGIIDYKYKDKIYSAYEQRNKIHDSYEEMVKNEVVVALNIHEKLFNIAKKYYMDFNDDVDKPKDPPSFKPIELDTSDDEIELVQIPDFSNIIEFKYDYCVICGEPNHSSYSLCCPKCSRILDNANNFISIRNYFGKDATLTKEKLIEYGLHEGYVNQLVTDLVQEDMLKVSGRQFTFNNMNFDRYMKKIYDYLAVGELITKFRENKIEPKDIKQTREYKEGSLHHEPFYEFYKIINLEIINKFEDDIPKAENIWKSIEFSTITQKQLETWYLKNLGQYQRGIINDSFVDFNNLLMADYIDLKRRGLSEKEIKSQLNISPKVYEFWGELNDSFEDEITQIKKDLILNALKEGKTTTEAIEIAGVTPHEFDNIYKVSNYYNDEYADEINREIECRKLSFTCYLGPCGLKTACKFAKITIDEFYQWYDSAKMNSPFYLESTKILMQKYLDERKKGKTKIDSVNAIDFKEKYIDQWLNRGFGIYEEFNDDNLKVTLDLVLRGFKWNKSKEEIAQMAEINVKSIDWFLNVGKKGSEIYKPLFEYYESEIIPQKLSKFLKENETKSMHKALAAADLTYEELDRYYNLGKSGDERFTDFYNEFLNIKKGTYVFQKDKGKSHKIAMRESYLTQEEYEECRDDLDRFLRKMKFDIVLDTVVNKKTSNVAASKANVSVDEIYEWYFKGKDGDEDYVGFYETFHKAYVKPSAVPLQEKLDAGNMSVDILIRSNKHLFTKKDFDIWLKNGIIKVSVLNLDKDDKDDDDDDSKPNKNEVKEISLKQFHRMTTTRSSLGRVKNKKYDIEELKKEILRK